MMMGWLLVFFILLANAASRLLVLLVAALDSDDEACDFFTLAVKAASRLLVKCDCATLRGSMDLDWIRRSKSSPAEVLTLTAPGWVAAATFSSVVFLDFFFFFFLVEVPVPPPSVVSVIMPDSLWD